MNAKVLIVDDEDDLCVLLKESLERLGYVCDICFNATQAKRKLERFEFDIVITDLNMGAEYGLEVVSHVTEKYPNTPVIVMSAFGNQDISVMALKLGAFDFINKPIDNIELHSIMQKALGNSLSDVPEGEEVLRDLVGESDAIKNLKQRVRRIAKGQAPVFIQGESGAGKEVIASIVHRLSSRANGPYIVINCGAIPAELIESELFGHKKGSFTGATQDKIGLLQSADGGTLFLDEVAELPLPMQVKLLRAVQEKKIRPVGSDKEVFVDFRIVSATHRNLEAMVNQGQFRQDLYFRLHVMDVMVPALRDRGNDVILLAEFFCKKICAEWCIREKKISPDVKGWLLNQKFLGNVRELSNLMQRAITMSESDYVTLEDMDANSGQVSSSLELKINISPAGVENLEHAAGYFPTGLLDVRGGILDQFTQLQQPVAIPQDIPHQTDEIYVPKKEGLEAYMDEVERKILENVLESVHYNISVAAKILKLNPRSLRYRMQKFDLKFEE